METRQSTIGRPYSTCNLRVVKFESPGGPPTGVVIWEGFGIKALEAEFPKRRKRNGRVEDPLKDGNNAYTGKKVNYVIQFQGVSGWQRLDSDPREVMAS